MNEAYRRVPARRLATACVAGVVAVAVFAGAGLAEELPATTPDEPVPSQLEDGKKVTVCHKGKRAIRIAVWALPAHELHGDVVGPCSEVAQTAKQARKAAKQAAKAAKRAAKQAAKAAKQAAEQTNETAQDDLESQDVSASFSGPGHGKGKKSK